MQKLPATLGNELSLGAVSTEINVGSFSPRCCNAICYRFLKEENFTVQMTIAFFDPKFLLGSRKDVRSFLYTNMQKVLSKSKARLLRGCRPILDLKRVCQSVNKIL